MFKKTLNALKPFFTKSYIKNNKKKVVIFLIIILLIIFGIYKIFANDAAVTTYNVGSLGKGDVISTISTSGQVLATNQIEIKSKNSGTISSINAITGQEVKAGTVIAQVYDRDAWYAYQSAKISYQKLVKPADNVSTIQAENNLNQAKNTLGSSYTEAKVNIDNVFVDMPEIINGLNNMYYTNSGILSGINETSLPSIARMYKSEAGINLDNAKRDFNTNLSLYKSYNSQSSNEDLKTLIDKTYANVELMTKAVRGTKNTLDYLQNSNTSVANLSTNQSNVNAWLNTLNNHLTKLVNAKSNINIAEKSITEKESSLQDVQDGADYLDVQAAKLSLDQKAAAYSDSFIKAPFDGVIAKVDVKKGDEISSNTSVATIITKQKVVSIDLNEVDIAKVKIGQSATVTFDAIDNFTATGTVASVDWVGTVSQGVVSYNVQITLNTEDARIMSGMSSSVIIDTDSKYDVYILPNNAIKTQNGVSFVEVVKDDSVEVGESRQLDKTQITRKRIAIGISDDDNTEIVSGLTETDKIILKINNSNATIKTNTSSAPSLFGNPGGGGNFRSGTGGTRTNTNR